MESSVTIGISGVFMVVSLCGQKVVTVIESGSSGT